MTSKTEYVKQKLIIPTTTVLDLVYVSDIAGPINETILVSDKYVDAIEPRLGAGLDDISVWLVDNKLSSHLGRTQSPNCSQALDI